MKKLIIATILFINILSAYAQGKQKPMPDWMFSIPQSTSKYEYIREKGNPCPTEKEARISAMTQVFSTVSKSKGIRVSQAEIESALQTTGNIIITDNREIDIPINKVDEYTVLRSDKKFEVYILCQVATMPYYRVPSFDTFTPTYTEYKSISYKKNVNAIVASIFIPGLGQMTKRNYGEGVGTLLGEAALIGGGVTMLVLSNDQKKIMDDASGSTDYNMYMDAKNKYNTYRYTSYGFFGAAVVLYGINLWRAWACKCKFKNMAFYPTIIPETSNTSYAFGIGLNIDF